MLEYSEIKLCLLNSYMLTWYWFKLFGKVICRDTIRCNELNRGSYMSAYVLLNLLNELGKRDQMRGLPCTLSLFRNEFK